MILLTAEQNRTLNLVSKIALANPFLPERIELERELLGDEFIPRTAHKTQNNVYTHGGNNLPAIARRTAETLKAICKDSPGVSLLGERRIDPKDQVTILRNAAGLVCYTEFSAEMDRLLTSDLTHPRIAADIFERCARRYAELLNFSPSNRENRAVVALEFSLYIQLRRAVTAITKDFLGSSRPAVELRAAVWQSIFTHDMSRYLRCLHPRMQDFSTLVTGPSGTGKELVARTIATCRFVPYDVTAGAFPADPPRQFEPINLSALSPNLIESELFGHAKGSFTGATADRRGYLEIDSPNATAFLDEIGELDASIQVKLLRILQSRTFQRVGDWRVRRFEGKIITATNRNLDKEVSEGRFREDLYYRLCSDQIRTPSLREQIEDAPETLEPLVHAFALRLVGPEEADLLAEETLRFIARSLPPRYPWPGNIRELEQLLRNVLIRRNYNSLLSPRSAEPEADPLGAFFDAFRKGELTLGQVQQTYCLLVHRKTDSWQESARRLDIDHRTVKAHVTAGESETQKLSSQRAT